VEPEVSHHMAKTLRRLVIPFSDQFVGCDLLSVITVMNTPARVMLWINVPWRSLLMAGHVP
jgi:hypothetical protein